MKESERLRSEQIRVADTVKKILSTDERARNSDLWLILQVWQKEQQIKLFVPYDKLGVMIAPESITRARRVIQNERHEYLPTVADVLRRRRFKADVLHMLFAENPTLKEEFYQVS